MILRSTPTPSRRSEASPVGILVDVCKREDVLPTVAARLPKMSGPGALEPFGRIDQANTALKPTDGKMRTQGLRLRAAILTPESIWKLPEEFGTCV